jgi:hypothetical protein
MSTIRVFEKNSNDILFECSADDADKAYEFAAQMEEIGLEVVIKQPSVAESLSMTLGAKQEELEDIRNEIRDEIESHNEGSCCYNNDEPIQ